MLLPGWSAGGAQTITLGAGCGTGAAIHEIGHAVGLWHEQSREDRGTFVRINRQNIEPGREHNFDQHITDGDDVGGYDYGSIMHYPRTAFSRNGQPTIEPLQAGAVIGQSAGLSNGDRGAVRVIYPALEPTPANTYRGDFTGDARTDLLFYLRSRMTWFHGMWTGSGLGWNEVGNTAGFGQVGDGRPFYTGDFTGDGRSDVMFYFPGDQNWWLGTLSGGQLRWSHVGNTAGFGQVADGRPFWAGDFTGDGRADVLFYFPGDQNWWLGSVSGGQLRWSHVGNTAGFGQIWDGRPFWTGRFGRPDRDEVLFYFSGDANWWRGSHDGAQLGWSLAANF